LHRGFGENHLVGVKDQNIPIVRTAAVSLYGFFFFNDPFLKLAQQVIALPVKEHFGPFRFAAFCPLSPRFHVLRTRFLVREPCHFDR
jgi:hypothetical protein